MLPSMFDIFPSFYVKFIEEYSFNRTIQILRFTEIVAFCHLYMYTYIKTHDSESRGRERAKRSPKTKCVTNYCVSITQANVFVI